MNLEELTFKQVCNCLGLIKKLVVENIINFDIDTGIATLNYDNAIKYLENQNLEQKQEIERLNKGLEYMKLYWNNREEYEKNELLNQIRDKDTSIEWLERAIKEEKKRERLY